MLDSFHFQQTKTPTPDDNIAVNNLPKAKSAAQDFFAAGIVDKYMKFKTEQQLKNLPASGDVAADAFLQSHPKVGEPSAGKIHGIEGLQPHSGPAAAPAAPAAPKIKAPKAPKAGQRKQAWSGAWGLGPGALTRRVAGWNWDQHLLGYTSPERRQFTCACGEPVQAPSYKTCSCGTVWNVYALGDGHHLANDSAEMYIAREVKPGVGVILASKDMEPGIPSGHGEMGYDSGPGRVRGFQSRTSSELGPDSASSQVRAAYFAGASAEAQRQWKDERVSGLPRRQAGSEEQDLADSQSGGDGLSRSAGWSAGSAPQRRSARQSVGEPGLRYSEAEQPGYGSSRYTVATEEDTLSRRASAARAESYAEPTATRTSSMFGVREGEQSSAASSGVGLPGRIGSVLPEDHDAERLASLFFDSSLVKIDDDSDNDWRTYDEPDPARQSGPKKPPSTTIKGNDPHWHSRQPDGQFGTKHLFG